MKAKILLLTLLFTSAFLYAQTTLDSIIVNPSEKFSAKQLLLPTNHGWLNKINHKIQNKITDWRNSSI